MKTLLGIFMLITLLSGCGARHVNETVQNTTSLDTQDAKEPFVLVNPLKDDPENPSPHNPLIKKFGDIPQVRTYMRLQQKLLSGTPLTRDEVIAFFTAEFHLYRSPSTAEALKQQKESKKRDEKLGFSSDLPVFRYTGQKIIDFSRVNRGGGISVTMIDPDGTKTIIDPRLNDGEPLIILSMRIPFVNCLNHGLTRRTRRTRIFGICRVGLQGGAQGCCQNIYTPL